MPMNVPPNKVLFVQNLPEDCSDMMLQPLFQTYPGFKEVRLVPGMHHLYSNCNYFYLFCSTRRFNRGMIDYTLTFQVGTNFLFNANIPIYFFLLLHFHCYEFRSVYFIESCFFS